jgi:hypothetical protein
LTGTPPAENVVRVYARVLLISYNRFREPYPVFPLGTAYLADSLCGAGHSVLGVDLNIDGEDWKDRARAFARTFAASRCGTWTK